MSKACLSKRERILQVLIDNSNTWLSAGEIAKLCLGGKYTTAADVSMSLRGEINVESKNVGTDKSHARLVYRYTEVEA